MNTITLTQEFLESKVVPYLTYLNSDERYERFHINNILYGVDVYVTENDNIKFTLYNLRGVFGGHCAELDILVNPNTFEYKIKPKALYGGLDYTIPIENSYGVYHSAYVVTSNSLSENEKIIFDGVIANTLYQTFYGYYKRLHPIWDKDFQCCIFGKCCNDNLE